MVESDTALTYVKYRKTLLNERRRLAETGLDSLEQLIAHLAVDIQDLIPASLALHDAGIEGVPELDLGRHGPRELEGAVMGLGRERDDDVEGGVLQLIEGFRPVAGDVDADLSMTATANPSSSPGRTPAESVKTRL